MTYELYVLIVSNKCSVIVAMMLFGFLRHNVLFTLRKSSLFFSHTSMDSRMSNIVFVVPTVCAYKASSIKYLLKMFFIFSLIFSNFLCNFIFINVKKSVNIFSLNFHSLSFLEAPGSTILEIERHIK